MSNREKGWLLVIISGVGLIVVGTAAGLVLLEMWDRGDVIQIVAGLALGVASYLVMRTLLRIGDGRN